jgi:hypothetical protein
MDIVHSPRELIKITKIKDSAIYSTKSLGLWYVPLGSKGTNKEEMAKELGGNEWSSPSASWYTTHNDEVFRTFPVAGFYQIKD